MFSRVVRFVQVDGVVGRHVASLARVVDLLGWSQYGRDYFGYLFSIGYVVLDLRRVPLVLNGFREQYVCVIFPIFGVLCRSLIEDVCEGEAQGSFQRDVNCPPYVRCVFLSQLGRQIYGRGQVGGGLRYFVLVGGSIEVSTFCGFRRVLFQYWRVVCLLVRCRGTPAFPRLFIWFTILYLISSSFVMTFVRSGVCGRVYKFFAPMFLRVM